MKKLLLLFLSLLITFVISKEAFMSGALIDDISLEYLVKASDLILVSEKSSISEITRETKNSKNKNVSIKVSKQNVLIKEILMNLTDISIQNRVSLLDEDEYFSKLDTINRQYGPIVRDFMWTIITVYNSGLKEDLKDPKIYFLIKYDIPYAEIPNSSDHIIFKLTCKHAFESIKTLDKVKTFIKEARFIHAAKGGDIKTAELLIKDKVKINSKDPDGKYPLHIASENDQKDFIGLLVGSGVDLNIKDKDGGTALMIAAEKGFEGIVDLLISKGAGANEKDKNGITALEKAIWNSKSEVIEYLVAKGANVNSKRNDGFTVLMAAAYRGNIKNVEFLISQGADIKAKDSEGKTAINYALNKGHREIAELLKKQGRRSKKQSKGSGLNY